MRVDSENLSSICNFSARNLDLHDCRKFQRKVLLLPRHYSHQLDITFKMATL